MSQHHVVALALPEVIVFDLAIPAHVFGYPGVQQGYCFTVCAERAGPVPSTSGFAIQATHGLRALATADTVIVPGYAPPLAEPAPAALRALRRAAAGGARIASVCTGAFALAYAGLLDGRTVTTHWHEAAALAARFPAVRVDPSVLYVDEGSVLTSAGVAAGVDLCLHMVRADHGAEVAADIARGMVVAPHRSGGQAQFLQRPILESGLGLAATCTWALDRLHEPLTVADMARHAGFAPRTLSRHFHEQLGASPVGWLNAQRVLHARRLLEQTDLPIDLVARRCGLGTGTNLRKHFARDTTTTPSAYRSSFRGVGTSNG